ncbi:hypothetical protein HPP92_018724 [Vanilla planifolia]|uniref:Uncharacterized protein n=1 Tax=Vanilla planifolia TaxID=51239 RepID=A0A835QCK4_VANPL|nr:hypothetical protein HPP92_018724 [Vanilla planifolia]
MVSEAGLVERLRDILRSSDLSTTTAAIVRRKLEEDFGVDLTEKKMFIREQIDIFLNELQEKGGEEEEENGEGEDDTVKEMEVGGNGCEGEDDDEEETKEEEAEEEKEANDCGNSIRKRRSNKLTEEVKKRGGGFTKLCSLSPQLQEFVGVSELARTEVVKHLWAYIRENNLQDPSNKRRIVCDERLQNLFKVNAIDMFQMNKVLSKHIWPLSSENVKSVTPEKPQKTSREDSEDTTPKGKRQKGGNTGFLAPLPLSDALSRFIGTGESALSRSDVVKRIWDYIKQNKLQDPADKRNIICDEKLKELLQVNSFNGFTVSKLLSAHFVKTK